MVPCGRCRSHPGRRRAGDPVSLVVDAPGLYLGVPDDVYHSDTGAVSSTGLRRLLPPYTPDHFRHEQVNGQKAKAEFDFGHAAHLYALGVGARIVIPADPGTGEPFELWNTKECKAQVARAREAGHVPLKRREDDKARAMISVLREHPTAGPLFDLEGEAESEASLWWIDPGTGVWCRARFDVLRRLPSGRLLGVDYKTCDDASPTGFAKSVGSWRYDQQEAHYCAGAAVLGEPCEFLFVAQEKAPPYRVGVYRLDDEWAAIGHDRNRRALEVYAECLASGRWPGYSPEVVTAAAPRWVTT